MSTLLALGVAEATRKRNKPVKRRPDFTRASKFVRNNAKYLGGGNYGVSFNGKGYIEDDTMKLVEAVAKDMLK